MIELSRDCDKHQSNHGGEYLQAHGVLVEGDELTDAEVLLDPAEQELDLPARLVGGGKLSGAAGLMVMRRRKIGSLESPLLASVTSRSALTVKPSPLGSASGRRRMVSTPE